MRHDSLTGLKQSLLIQMYGDAKFTLPYHGLSIYYMHKIWYGSTLFAEAGHIKVQQGKD